MRLLVQFKALWMLVRGFVSSAGTMFYTLVLLLLMLYVFACLGVEIITKNRQLREDDQLDDLVHERFPSIIVTMRTLLQFATLDTVSAIYIPFMDRSPIL